MTKEDRRTGRQTGKKKKGGGWGKRELGAGDPSRRISPCTLLSYEGSFPSRWPQRRGEEGEGGVRLLRFFFFFPFPPDGDGRLCLGRPDLDGLTPPREG